MRLEHRRRHLGLAGWYIAWLLEEAAQLSLNRDVRFSINPLPQRPGGARPKILSGFETGLATTRVRSDGRRMAENFMMAKLWVDLGLKVFDEIEKGFHLRKMGMRESKKVESEVLPHHSETPPALYIPYVSIEGY